MLLLRQANQQGCAVDVVSIETRNNNYDGVKVIKLIKDESPEVAVLALTEYVV